MIRQASEDVQKIRAVMRFLLGNLNNVSEEKLDMVKLENLSLVDQYILHLLTEFVEMVSNKKWYCYYSYVTLKYILGQIILRNFKFSKSHKPYFILR